MSSETDRAASRRREGTASGEADRAPAEEPTQLEVPPLPGEGSRDGKRLGRYVLRYQVAQGGMATVYLAQMAGPQGFGKWVAIKWIHPHLAQEARFLAMFLDEARVTAQVRHPNVCQVVDFVDEDGTSYIVMEYLHGESFSIVTRRAFDSPEGFPVRLTLRVLADAARGLHAAHDACGHDGEPLGIVHRDVSPQNIQVLYDGGTKMLDFGVARARGRVTHTETGEVKGKLAYMAPEQIRRGETDRRADVWSLGVVLWESLTGRRLFRGENEGQTVQRVLEGEIPRPSELRPDAGITEELDQVVLNALCRDPELRYPTAAALADDLEGVLYQLKTPTGPSQVSEWMADHFADKRAVRDQLLRAKFESSAGILAIDLESSGSSLVAPRAVAGPATLTPRMPSEPPPPTQERSQSPTWHRMVAIACAALFLMIVGASLQHFVQRDDPTPTPTVAPVAVPVAAPTPPPVEVAPVVAPPTAPAEVATADEDAHTKRAPRTVAAAPGMLNLLGLPPADVYYRGERIGRTPLVNRSLPAGRQRLELRWGEERRSITVEIRSGETTRQTVRRE